MDYAIKLKEDEAELLAGIELDALEMDHEQYRQQSPLAQQLLKKLTNRRAIWTCHGLVPHMLRARPPFCIRQRKTKCAGPPNASLRRVFSIRRPAKRVFCIGMGHRCNQNQHTPNRRLVDRTNTQGNQNQIKLNHLPL